jgi:S-DNA-T family DNA segregation ATPase FtsK/SpoIIIE
VADTAARHAPRRPALDEASRDALARTLTADAENSLDTPETMHEHEDNDPEGTLWAALSIAPDEGMSVPDLVARTGMSRRWIYYRIRELAKDGAVIQTARGLWRARRDHD